ncbi:hypothetical protein Fmac_031999 [Flemingia macrophylla]|uniref:Uncharacterized protein n=1 Tax=Flemingia macrophylla TaxID=520843 RepID=A0ABD1L430_9FABA
MFVFTNTISNETYHIVVMYSSNSSHLINKLLSISFGFVQHLYCYIWTTLKLSFIYRAKTSLT